MSLFYRLGRIVGSQIKGFKEEFKKGLENEDYTYEESSESYWRPEKKKPTKESEYYANLELKEGASFQEIKASYRRLMGTYHPDRHSHDPAHQAVAEEITQKLNEAYQYFKKKEENGK